RSLLGVRRHAQPLRPAAALQPDGDVPRRQVGRHRRCRSRATPGTGERGDVQTAGDPSFSPLGAPATNLQGPNFTPPFPAYPSGHATFGGAVFQMLRNYFRTDNIPFTFV